MGRPKLIVSGLSVDDLLEFDALVSAVRKVADPTLHRVIDRSVLARFAVKSVVREHKSDPEKLARALGFEVRR